MSAFALALALLGASDPSGTSEKAEGCRIKDDPPATRLMVAAHYKAKTHSTAWLGEPDETTGVVDVRLDPGDPVHLVLMTYRPVVYRLSGHVVRVRQLTLISDKGAGAVGIARHRVSFLPRCLSYEEGAEAEGLAKAMARLAGRRPDAVATSYGVWRLRVGRRIDGIERKDRPPWSYTPGPETRLLLRHMPGGIARIDPAAMVTDVAAGEYEVLPEEAGLRQLLASGALVRATVADAEAWEAAARMRGLPVTQRPDIAHQSYRVVRPIRIPAGLCGAHRVSLYARNPEHVQGGTCHSELFFDDGTGIGLFRR